jgi:hypothetical protein
MLTLLSISKRSQVIRDDNAAVNVHQAIPDFQMLSADVG